MAKKRVFLSFIAEDRDRVQGLRLLAANPNYDLEFYDESVRAPIDSANAEYIKGVIREKINRTTVTVCLISEKTHTSKWVRLGARGELQEGEHDYRDGFEGGRAGCAAEVGSRDEPHLSRLGSRAS